MHTMSLAQRTLKAGTWQLTAVVTKAALQLAVLAVLARYVSPSEFGYIAMANMVIAAFLFVLVAEVLGRFLFYSSQVAVTL